MSESAVSHEHVLRRGATGHGLVIVFEGGEGVGKSTQWRLLAERLTSLGESVVLLREPGGTPPGDVIRSLLLNPEHAVSPATEALLFAASRAELVRRSILPARAAGQIVLLDRYLLSSYVYQGWGRGLDLGSLRAVNTLATSGLVPDCTILLELPLDLAMLRLRARGVPDRMEQEALPFHERVSAGFEHAASETFQSEYPECGPITVVQAEGAASKVAERCLAVLSARWPSRFPPMS